MLYVWRFADDGKFDGWTWAGPIELIPSSVRPVTEPAEWVARYRQGFGLPHDHPVYATEGPRLRLWGTHRGYWVDDRVQLFGWNRWRRSFAWRFKSLTGAVEAILEFFRALALGNRA
jgi:hypothetical protein